MNKSDEKKMLAQEVEAIQETLRSALLEAECALAEIQSGRSLARFRKSFLMDMLNYIVRLDSAMAAIHQHRQKIMEVQVQATSTAN